MPWRTQVKIPINFSDSDPLEVIDDLAKAVWVDCLGIDATFMWNEKLVGNGVKSGYVFQKPGCEVGKKGRTRMDDGRNMCASIRSCMCVIWLGGDCLHAFWFVVVILWWKRHRRDKLKWKIQERERVRKYMRQKSPGKGAEKLGVGGI